MKTRAPFPLFAICCLASAFGRADAQPLLDTAIPFGGAPDAVSVSFDVATATSADWTIVDFGVPAPLDRLYVALTRGSSLIASADSSGARNMQLDPGAYELVIVGVPETASVVGSLGVTLREAGGGAVIVDTVQSFELPQPAVASPAAFEHRVTVAMPGTYEVVITDLGTPASLASLSTLIVPAGGSPIGPPFNGSGVVSFGANAGNYDIFVFAELAPTQARGLVGVAFRPSGGATSFSAVDEIGEWPYRFPVDVAAPTTLTTTVTDLGFPQPLAALRSVLTGDGLLIDGLVGAGSFDAAVGTGQFTLYVDAAAAGGSTAGSFGAIVENSAAERLLERVQPVINDSGPVTDVEGIDASFQIAQAGDYTLTFADFGLTGFFDPFTSATLTLTDNRQIISSLTTPGSFTFAAVPGSYSVAVIADPAGASGSGLLGISIAGGPAGAVVYEQTAAVGARFQSREVAVGSAVSLDVSVTDLGFPGTFDDLRVAVTRGGVREGEVFGGGSFTIDATPGTYIVNLLAEPDAATGYSLLGVNVTVSPEAPTVVLSSSATSVVVGGSAGLTWSSTGATDCSASGAWTGSRATSGSTTVGPLRSPSTFTLSCTGPGGTNSASVTIAITPEQRSGGGGALGILELLLLTALLAFRGRSARRSAHAGNG